MSVWKRLFGRKTTTQPQQPEKFEWLQLPTISAIALLDADVFSRAPGILHGFLGLREILVEAAGAVFPKDQPQTLSELTAMKCQLIASVDTNSGLTTAGLGPATKSLCSEHGFDLVDSDSRGCGIPTHYSAMFPEAWGEFHVIVNANLTKDHWRHLFAIIPKQLDAPARFGLGKSSNGEYVVVVLHRQTVTANNLVSRDFGPSFGDFCSGVLLRMKKERVPYDVVQLGEVLGQSYKRR